MYNQEIKMRYKAEKEAMTVLPYRVFELDFGKTEPFEEQLQKDVFDFTIYETLNMYKTWNIKSIDTLYVINSRLRQYTQWALEQNLVIDNQNHFAEINRDMLFGCINVVAKQNRIVSREQIIAWCSRLINANDKFILLGLYEGLEGKNYEDLWNTSMDDIDKVNKTIKTSRGVLPISQHLIEFAEECNETMTLYPTSGEEGRTIKLVENGKIIKNKINTTYDDAIHKGKSVYVTMKRICAFLGIDKWFNTRECNESGMINMIQRRMKETGMGFHDFVYSEYMAEVELQYNRKIVKSSFYKKYKDIMTDV